VLQALPLVASGAADALGLTDAELALACASHGGEPQHAPPPPACWPRPASMPERAGVRRALALQRQRPSARAGAPGEQPSALHNNCSGKHAGFVCLGCHMAARRPDRRGFLRGYVSPTTR
jgi:L-asparaginase II